MQISTADLGPAGDVEDDQLVLDGLGERLVGVGGLGDGVAGGGQDGGGRVARRRVGRQEQDGTGGHGASAW